jgi:site-specific DNA recombinase
MAVTPLIDRKTFDTVQARLKSRHPMVTPSRVTSGPTLLAGICFCAKCRGAMTLRTGKGSAGGMYRYYTCSTKARQGKTGCKGRSMPMSRLDDLVADHIEDRLLRPERLETILASVLDRRQERTERRRQHLAELNQRIAETDQRLNRLYDAIETGVADLDDLALKERIAGLKTIQDQARADAERAQAALGSAGNQAVSPDMIKTFARTAAASGWRLPPRPPSRLGSAHRGGRQGGSHHGIDVGTAAHARRCFKWEIGGFRRSQWRTVSDSNAYIEIVIWRSDVP